MKRFAGPPGGAAFDHRRLPWWEIGVCLALGAAFVYPSWHYWRFSGKRRAAE